VLPRAPDVEANGLASDGALATDDFVDRPLHRHFITAGELVGDEVLRESTASAKQPVRFHVSIETWKSSTPASFILLSLGAEEALALGLAMSGVPFSSATRDSRSDRGGTGWQYDTRVFLVQFDVSIETSNRIHEGTVPNRAASREKSAVRRSNASGPR
jgi:hypothetical protein